MPAVICGSLAYDTIMVFQDQFKNHILPEQVHILNVSFLVPAMRREFGGCAGNIAYNLKLLGGDPLPVATVGQDFAPYRKHLEQCGIRLSSVREFDDQFTPQCFITTDLDNNQITAFHPGAMSSAHENHVRDIPQIDFSHGTDFEGEVGVVVGDVPMGISAEKALEKIILFMVINDVSLRGLIPEELAQGFGFFQSKPSTAFAPFAASAARLLLAVVASEAHLSQSFWLAGLVLALSLGAPWA